MSIDKSLKLRSRLVRPRSVLTRSERLEILAESERWKEGDSIYGLPKVRVRHAKRRSARPKKEEPAAVPGAEGETPETKEETPA